MIQTIIDNLLNLLPHNYSKNQTSNIGKLINMISEQLTEINDKRLLFKEAQDIDQAENSYLDLLGHSVGQMRGSLSDGEYRILIKAKIQQNLSGGDINQLYNYLSAILNADLNNLLIYESPEIEPAQFKAEINAIALANSGVNLQNIYDILNLLRAAGVGVSTFSRGTFQFRKSLTGIFQFSSQPGTIEVDINTGFSSVANYNTSGGKFLSSSEMFDPERGFADVDQTTGGFFGSVIE